jgi:hypothetical protein
MDAHSGINIERGSHNISQISPLAGTRPFILEFFKYVALLSFAATVIAGAISPGTYLIINTAYDGAFATVQCVFIYNTGENPGPYEFVSPSLGRLSLNMLLQLITL